MDEAARLFEDLALRTIGKTTIDGVTVSTIHLVVGHPCGGCGAPDGWCMGALFETLIRGPDGWEDFQRRYHTQIEAIRGHAEVVEMVQTR